MKQAVGQLGSRTRHLGREGKPRRVREVRAQGVRPRRYRNRRNRHSWQHWREVSPPLRQNYPSSTVLGHADHGVASGSPPQAPPIPSRWHAGEPSWFVNLHTPLFGLGTDRALACRQWPALEPQEAPWACATSWVCAVALRDDKMAVTSTDLHDLTKIRDAFRLYERVRTAAVG